MNETNMPEVTELTPQAMRHEGLLIQRLIDRYRFNEERDRMAKAGAKPQRGPSESANGQEDATGAPEAASFTSDGPHHASRLDGDTWSRSRSPRCHQ